jgi:hypothetical protein
MTVQLRGPSNIMFILETGKLDDRARLAFGAGQCHGLALALHRRTGWPMVAVHRADGTCIHITVRRPDGLLVDVTGAHTREDIEAESPGCSLRDITDDGISELMQNEGWAPPEVDQADAWTEAVLTNAATRPPSVPLRTPTFERTLDHASGIQVQVL